MKPKTALLVVLLSIASLSFVQSASTVDAVHSVEPADLAKQLKTAKPLVFMVGPHTLYAQAHIPGAEFIGMTSQDEGRKSLQDRVRKVPKTQAIVLYCGCCPWDRCPNIAPAFNELTTLGYKNVRVLHIAQNFGIDWMAKGFPVQKEAAAVAGKPGGK